MVEIQNGFQRWRNSDVQRAVRRPNSDVRQTFFEPYGPVVALIPLDNESVIRFTRGRIRPIVVHAKNITKSGAKFSSDEGF